MTQSRKQAICRACGEDFGYDWREWAKHTINQKDKAHKKSRRFALRILSNARKLDQKRDLIPRVPLTEEQREAKREMRRELSGEHERVLTICPKCKQPSGAMLEVEHTQNIDAWRIGKRLAVLCNQCRG